MPARIDEEVDAYACPFPSSTSFLCQSSSSALFLVLVDGLRAKHLRTPKYGGTDPSVARNFSTACAACQSTGRGIYAACGLARCLVGSLAPLI